MLKTMTIFRAALAVLAVSVQLQAGGFWLISGNPEASADAKNKQAVVTVKAVGCHQPETATVIGTAIGTVNGQRKVLPLKLEPTSTPGMYTVARQWPAEGKWVLSFEGRYGESKTSLMLTAGPSGVDRTHQKQATGAPDQQQIEALLAN
ncbi:hypothetical protein [Paludibaculum fermentans]|uniref:hypothetical protein n=1 Tax=Paludibaculum fermentans TaxID=1473598 RepID=UPI003EBBA8B1